MTDTRTTPNIFKGFFFALAATVLISTNYITGKVGVAGFGADTFGLVWVSAAAGYALAIIALTGRARELILPAKSWSMVILLGVFTGIQMPLFYGGLDLLNAPFAAFVGRFEPAMTILLATVFLCERLKRIELIAVTVMIAGGCVSTIGNWKIVGLGTLLTLLACLSMSIQFLIGKMNTGQVHPSVLVFYRVAIAAGVLAVWTFGFRDAKFSVAPKIWLVTLLGAFLGPCASYHLTFRSYRYWDMSRTATLMTLQPLFATPLAFIFLADQQMTAQQLWGGLTIMLGAFALVWFHVNPNNRTTSTSPS
ncbi:MAG: DMT family transporter [Candidatus Poribacteria bacterium]|nr:DMT family transporter [Candidatus Poribacteria bacterium]